MIKQLLAIFCMFFFIGNVCFSQNLMDVKHEPEQDPVLTVVDKMPEYPGGQDAMFKFISSNLRYPADAQEAGIQGRVYANFIVEKDGRITGISIRRGLHKSCDEEVIRVIKAMPKWKPGEQNGKAVRVNFVLPVVFKLMN